MELDPFVLSAAGAPRARLVVDRRGETERQAPARRRHTAREAIEARGRSAGTDAGTDAGAGAETLESRREPRAGAATFICSGIRAINDAAAATAASERGIR